MLKAFESEEVMQRFTLRECGTVEAAQRKCARGITQYNKQYIIFFRKVQGLNKIFLIKSGPFFSPLLYQLSFGR